MKYGNKIAIVQSCYIPWKGYFDIICKADQFILYDCVQYTRRDWRNRNRIKTKDGLLWLTIPVKHRARNQLIYETEVMNDDWTERHWKSIQHCYSKTPFFSEYRACFASLYQRVSTQRNLSYINKAFIEGINQLLNIQTKIDLFTTVPAGKDKNERLLSICKTYGATTYISGPSAQAYLDVECFNAEGIQIEWMDYNNYLPYPQAFPPFEHYVSIIDLIFNTGPNALQYMQS